MVGDGPVKNSIYKLIKILITVTLVTMLSTGCATRKNLPLGEVPTITPPSELKVIQTKQYIERGGFEKGKILPIASPESKRVIRIVRRLKEAAGGKNIDLPVYTVDAGPEMVNALAVNGSAVLVFKALLDKIEDDNQVAAILAHELGHLSGKHSEDKGEEKRSKWVSIGSTIVGVAASVAVAAAGGSDSSISIAGDLGYGISKTVGTGGLVMAYSREMENEADQIGIVLMARAGYPPEAAVSLWKNAEELLGEKSGGVSTFWSSHPSFADRFTRLEAALPYAKSQFKEQTPEQIREAKLEDAKLDKISTDTAKAQELYDEAMAQIRKGNKKGSVQSLKQYLGFAEQYGWSTDDVQNARLSLSLLERNTLPSVADPVSEEETAVLSQLRKCYVDQNVNAATVDQIISGIQSGAQSMSSAARLELYLSYLKQVKGPK